MRRTPHEVPVDELRRWLDDVEFPARPVDLLASALRHEPPDWVVEHLGRLPDRRFEELDEVCGHHR